MFPLLIHVPVPIVIVPLFVIPPTIVGESPKKIVVPLATVRTYTLEDLLIVTELNVTSGVSTVP